MKLSHFLLLFIILSLPQVLAQGTWEQLNSTVTSSLYKVQFVDSLTGWAAGDSGVIIKTTDGGENWLRQESGITSSIYDLFFLNARKGWGITWRSQAPPYGTNIIYTNNGGEEWFEMEYPDEDIFLHTIRFLDSLNGYIGGEGGNLKKTSDGGFTWRECEVEEEYSGFPILNYSLADSLYAYACGGHVDVLGIIWRTTDGGNYWSTTAVSPEPIYTLLVTDSLNALGMGGDWEYGTMVVATTDKGESWSYRTLNLYGIAHKMQFRTKHELWVALGAGQVLLHTNDSTRSWDDTLRVWDVIPTPDNSSIFDLAFTDTLHGYGVGEGGVVIRYKYTEPVGIREGLKIFTPVNYLAATNYPNPFNPQTTILYKTEEQGWLDISVYNSAGELVSVVFNGAAQIGKNSHVFDATSLPSGIYFYKIEFTPLLKPINKVTATGKMVHIK